MEHVTECLSGMVPWDRHGAWLLKQRSTATIHGYLLLSHTVKGERDWKRQGTTGGKCIGRVAATFAETLVEYLESADDLRDEVARQRACA